METPQEPFQYKKIELSDSAMMEQIYRLRYQVYCNECQFIKAEDYPDGIEIDEYDPQSVHFAAINQFNEVIGTMRMILPGALKLPIEGHCPNLQLEEKIHCAEVSRFIISRRLRRRANDKMYYEPQVEDKKIITADNIEFMRRAKPMAFGLYRALYQESKSRGITHWYTLMEKSLCILLSIHGFKFTSIGEAVDFYGPVQPYMGKMSEIEVEVKKKFPQFFDYFVQNP